MNSYYVLRYDVVADYVERREPYRSEHLALAHEYSRSGMLLLGGAVGSPPDSGLFVFRCPLEMVEAFVKRDPYVMHGLVPHYAIQPWSVVTGCDVK